LGNAVLDNSYTLYTYIIGWKFKTTIKPGNDFEERAEESDVYLLLSIQCWIILLLKSCHDVVSKMISFSYK